jgi:hypothetical protein
MILKFKTASKLTGLMGMATFTDNQSRLKRFDNLNRFTTNSKFTIHNSQFYPWEMSGVTNIDGSTMNFRWK